MNPSLRDTLRQLAPLLQCGHGRLRIKRDSHTPGLGLTETLYVVVDGLERRVSLVTPEKYWLAEQTPNRYLSSQLCNIRTTLEEEILARGWRLTLYHSAEGFQAQIYLGQRPEHPIQATCATHALALAPDRSTSLESLDEAGKFYRKAFFLAAQQALPPETCFDRRGNRAEVFYRGEGTTGKRTVLARVYDQKESTSGQLWNGEEHVFDQKWQPQQKATK